MADWQTYYDKHRSRPVRSQVVRAVHLCANKETALDLGAGTLVEARYLLESGFKRVVAVDSSPKILEFAKELDSKRLEVLVNPFQNLVLTPNHYDLITAQFALPFYGPKGFTDFFERLISSLKVGGVFTGQLFGDRDGWNTSESRLTFHTRTSAQELFKGMDIKEFEEEEKDGMTASGEKKHWHVFHFIVIK